MAEMLEARCSTLPLPHRCVGYTDVEMKQLQQVNCIEGLSFDDVDDPADQVADLPDEEDVFGFGFDLDNDQGAKESLSHTVISGSEQVNEQGDANQSVQHSKQPDKNIFPCLGLV